MMKFRSGFVLRIISHVYTYDHVLDAQQQHVAIVTPSPIQNCIGYDTQWAQTDN